MLPPPPTSPLFPYTTLFRSLQHRLEPGVLPRRDLEPDQVVVEVILAGARRHRLKLEPRRDRKSTRLNSSHITISYAVFCLKKKKKQNNNNINRKHKNCNYQL